MVATLVPGAFTWSLSRRGEGYREYKVVHRVRTNDASDGPYTVSQTAGLPAIGSVWNFGNDYDSWAFCTPEMSVTPDIRGEPCLNWTVEQTFSTKPGKRCQDTDIEDPMLEPQKVSGTFSIRAEEATEDKDGELISSSSHELLRGPQAEFDATLIEVIISQNVLNLELDVITTAQNRVNDAELWGVPARGVKLSNVSWEQKVYGVCCYYYTRTFTFAILYDEDDTTDRGFDRDLLDEGTKVLHGEWVDDEWVLWNIDGSAPNPNNPAHFDAYKDRKGENSRVVLNGAGLPASTKLYGGESTGDPGKIRVQKYKEYNFLELGIPETL